MIVADSDEEAQYLATSFHQFAVGIIRGTTKPLPAPVDTMRGLWSEMEAAAVSQMMTYTFIGGPATIVRQTQAFVNDNQVDELITVAHIYDHQARLRSYELLAELGNAELSLAAQSPR